MGFDFLYRNTRLPGGRSLEADVWYQQCDTEGVDSDQAAATCPVAFDSRFRGYRRLGCWTNYFKSATEGWYVLDQPIADDGSTVLGAQIGETTEYADGSSPDVRSLVDQDLNPMAPDEFLLGYERIVSDYIFGITFTWRDLVRGIGDITLDQAIPAKSSSHKATAKSERR